MKCTKMQGCGNDFVLIEEKECAGWDYGELSKKLCNRHYGMGADGIIVVKKEPLEFIYYNSDGSYSSFCGNGMRCFAKYCYEKGIVKENVFYVKCSKWVLRCAVEEDIVTVDLPQICQRDESGLISVCGSIHKVVEDKMMDESKYQQSDEYNLNLVHVINEEVMKIKTIERGAGLTLACGSGSIASAWEMKKKGKIKEKVVVYNPGGIIEIDLKNNEMKGEARVVYECVINENALKQEESAHKKNRLKKYKKTSKKSKKRC